MTDDFGPFARLARPRAVATSPKGSVSKLIIKSVLVKEEILH